MDGATGLLCMACTDDSQCGGNPCFQDATGARFCGAPCSSCPVGFSCHPIAGTSGTAIDSCFPDSNTCTGSGPGSDMAMQQPPPDFFGLHPDLTIPPKGPDMAVLCTPPSSSGVTNAGGTVDRLFFGFTGDTRPCGSADSASACTLGKPSGGHYPSALQTVINNIFTQMGKKGVQFAVDQGDHMEASNSTEATQQIGDYLTAAGKMGKPIFMTMGNHECSNSYNMGSDCSNSCSTDYKCGPFLNALKPVSSTPYYRFDVMTSAGLAVFIVIADDTWNSTQANWLTTQLDDADKNAKYTFVSKHHPEGNGDQSFFAQIESIVRAHKYTLFLTGHTHEFKREPGDPRAIVMGQGGAPFDNPKQMYWGYGTVLQCPDQHIYITMYDQATGNAMDSFNVPPQ